MDKEVLIQTDWLTMQVSVEKTCILKEKNAALTEEKSPQLLLPPSLSSTVYIHASYHTSVIETTEPFSMVPLSHFVWSCVYSGEGHE